MYFIKYHKLENFNHIIDKNKTKYLLNLIKTTQRQFVVHTYD